jgi:predicted nucleotidyltransferase
MTREEIESRLAQRLGADEFPGIVAAYLFGSEAEGHPHEESDVDVGVLLDRRSYPGARERFVQRLILASRLAGAAGGRRIDLVILNDAPPQFARRIVTAGRQLLCTDAEADHAFVRDIQLRAADLEPFLRRMRQIKLDYMGRP